MPTAVVKSILNSFGISPKNIKFDYVHCDLLPGACNLGTRCSSPPKSICRNVGGKASCVCPQFCPRILSPVCGSDGKSYDNLCLMEKAACEQNKTINETDFSNCGM